MASTSKFGSQYMEHEATKSVSKQYKGSIVFALMLGLLSFIAANICWLYGASLYISVCFALVTMGSIGAIPFIKQLHPAPDKVNPNNTANTKGLRASDKKPNAAMIAREYAQAQSANFDGCFVAPPSVLDDDIEPAKMSDLDDTPEMSSKRRKGKPGKS